MTTGQYVDPTAFLMGGGGKSASFKKFGDRVWGVIMNQEVKQQTDFDSGKPLTWDDGNPRMQLVVTLQTEEQDDDQDDGLRRVFIKGQMKAAVQRAVLAAKEKRLEDGGKLLVQYVADEPTQKRGASPTKQYAAKYEPPTQWHGDPEANAPDTAPPLTDEDLPF